MNKNYLRYKNLMYSARGIRMLILFLSFLILFSILGYTIANTYDQTKQKNSQLAVLTEDLKKEEEKNKELLKQKEFYQSDSFIEKEARNTLGLSYPNENIYIISHSIDQANPVANNTSPITNDRESEKSIFEKWLDLIFG